MPRKPTKRANRSGSVWSYKLANGSERWAVQLPAWSAIDGTRSGRVTKRGFTSHTAAENYRAEHALKARRGQLTRQSTKTLSEYLTEHVESLQIRSTTRAGYRTKITRHVLPSLGGKRLGDLTRGDLERLYRRLAEGGRADHRTGEGLSLATIKQVHAILSGALTEAERDGLITVNPARHARMPAPGQGKELGHEIHTWTAPDLARFLTATEGERYGALWHFLAMTGCRRGEALGLRWSDLHLDGQQPTASIRRSVTLASVGDGTKRVTIAPPKSGKARIIDLDAGTVSALRKWKARQAKERLAAGEAWSDPEGGALVFPRDAERLAEGGTPGEHLNPERCSRYFQGRVKAHGLPKIRLHDLRHTWATLALLAGVHPRVVQERLGHSTITITLQTYSHVTAGQQRQAAETVSAMLSANLAASQGASRDGKEA